MDHFGNTGVCQMFFFLFFRRAHLKECFDTLKKNIPNVDEKKTSNLSVLRSALRYIQVRKTCVNKYVVIQWAGWSDCHSLETSLDI